MDGTLPGMRHLTDKQAAAALSRGATVEQMVSVNRGIDVSWLRLSSDGQSVALSRHRVRDDGSDDFMDVYEFTPLGDDENLGEGRRLADFADAGDALAAAAEHGAQPGRWVNSGVIEDEYAEARSAE